MSNLIKLEDLRNEEYINEMNAVLTPEEKAELTYYLENKGLPLSPETAAKFFELYMTGTNCYDIWKLNKAFPFPAVLDARVKYRWDAQKDEYAIRLQTEIKNKISTAQLETADLMSDMLLAAKKLNSEKLKKYLQSGNEKDLDGALKIENLKSLKDIIEGLQSLTGQDRKMTIRNITENAPGVNPASPSTGGNLITSGQGIESLETDDAATILKIMAEAQRKKNNESNGKS